jgi:hypothetical protein
MFQVKLDESNSTRRRIPVLLVDATDGYTPETGLSTFTVNVSQNGTILGSQTQSLTEVGNGVYYYTLGTGAVNTLGWVTINVSATGCRQYNAIVQIMAYDAMDVVRLGLTAIPNAPQGTAGTLPTANASGAVTVVTNNDKGGYSLSASQTFDLTGSITGNLTGSVNSVTDGVSLASGAITTGSFGVGAIDASALATSAVSEIADAVWESNITHESNGTTNWGNNSFGDRVLRSDSPNQSDVGVNGQGHVASEVHAIQTTPVTTIAQGVLSEATSTNPATYAVGDVGNVLGRLNGMIQSDGSGDWQYDVTSLALAPTGGGGGGTTFVTGNVPYQVRADQQFPGGTVDIVVGTLLRLDLEVQDRDGNPINLTGATVTVGVRNASTGATVGTDQTATLSLARLGMIYVDTVTAWSATAGSYRMTVSATLGSDVIVAGPLNLIVRSR